MLQGTRGNIAAPALKPASVAPGLRAMKTLLLQLGVSGSASWSVTFWKGGGGRWNWAEGGENWEKEECPVLSPWPGSQAPASSILGRRSKEIHWARVREQMQKGESRS